MPARRRPWARQRPPMPPPTINTSVMNPSITCLPDLVKRLFDCANLITMRRQPAPDERKRDADRTRERILEAAIAEFGAHGFAGARVSAIAQRAGVNQQLISYYFDGKAGLYQALTD